MEVSTNHFLKFVPFSKFDLWDTKRYTSKSVNSNFEVVKLSSCINEESKKYKLFLEEEKDFGILGVNNKTGIFDAYVQKGKDINQPYKKMEIGWIAYNPYRINVGSIGIRLEEHKNEYISPAYIVFSCKENLLPEYLFLVFKTDTFNKVINENTTGSVRQNLSFDKLKDLEIPLPTLQEQQEIVEAYFSKINEANQLELEANNIDQEIEQYLFTQLGISTGNKIEKKKGLNLVEFSQLERWGVEYNLNSSNSLLSSKRFPNKRLKDILLINPTTTLPKEPNLSISFIPMEVVSDDYGIVTELRNKTVSESKGYTKFMEGDLIWARITPCMQNGKSAIVKNLENGLGVGSTEFHVLRNEDPSINLDYIYHFLRLDIVLKDAMSHFTGSAGQQRVPKSYLEELLIPIPEYQKQTEISNHLYQLKDLKIKLFNKAEQLKHQANEEFEKAIFQ